MPNVYLTPDELKAIKLVIESDIEVSGFDVPDYEDIYLMKYHLHRAEALEKVTYYLENEE